MVTGVEQAGQRISITASVGSVDSLVKAVSTLASVGASFQIGLKGNASRVVSIMHRLKGVGHASAALSLRGTSKVK